MKHYVALLFVIPALVSCNQFRQYPIDVVVENQTVPQGVACTGGLQITILDASGQNILAQSPKIADGENWNERTTESLVASGGTVTVETSCYRNGQTTGFFKGSKAIYPGVDSSSILVAVSAPMSTEDAEGVCWYSKDTAETLEKAEPIPCVVSG